MPMALACEPVRLYTAQFSCCVTSLMDNNQESNQVVNVLDFEHLLDSLYKCKKNVSWKESVANFYIHGIEQVLKLEEQLSNGTYVVQK